MDNPKIGDSIALSLRLLDHFKLPRLDDPESASVDLDQVAYYCDAFHIAAYNLRQLYAKRRKIALRVNRRQLGRHP